MRVGTMAWSSHLLSTGSRDRAILQRDIRAPEDFQHALRGHRSEVGRLLYLCTADVCLATASAIAAEVLEAAGCPADQAPVRPGAARPAALSTLAAFTETEFAHWVSRRS